MADKQASLIITLKDLASSSLGKLTGEFQKFKVGVLAAYDAVRPLVDFLVSSVKSYLESEAAVNKLNQALRAQGITSKLVSDDLQEYAKELQKTTTFSDESIMETEALLTTFGLFGDELKKTTSSALDLSVGLGIDLRTATLLLGKAANGETGALSRYGIQIDENATSAEKLNQVQLQIEKRFGGAAQAQLDTYTGKILALKNRFDELKEKIGAEMVPVMEFYTRAIERVMSDVEQLSGANDRAVTSTERHLLAMINAKNKLMANAREEGTLLEENTQRKILAFQEEITRLGQRVSAERQANLDIINDENAKATEKSNRRKKEVQDEIQRLKTLHADTKAYNQKIKDDTIIQEKQLTEQKEAENKIRAQGFYNTLNFISSLSTSKNKELAAIGKAAAITQATIDTFVAANVALRSAPPPFNFILAGLVTTAGLANVAKISGAKLAKGGVVMPRTGGTMATIGEAGKAEAVIPLGDERAREQLSGLGLNSTNLNINVQYLIGNENNVRELARIIDKELFTLRRNNESVAFEAL